MAGQTERHDVRPFPGRARLGPPGIMASDARAVYPGRVPRYGDGRRRRQNNVGCTPNPVSDALTREAASGASEFATPAIPATRTADRLREAGWSVTESTTIDIADVPATTVYFGAADGEQAAADAVGTVLAAPVAPRVPGIAEQPPGVIVLVTG